MALIAQKNDHIWVTGRGGGNQTPFNDEWGAIIFDFNQNNRPLILEKQEYDMNFYTTNSVISDSTGSLLFYSNGEKIYSKNHYLMPNGGNLMPGDGYGLRMNQGALTLPWPEHPGMYFVFCVEPVSGVALGTGFRYHLVDMNENSGLGKVIEKRKLLVQDTVDWGKVNATKHANGRDWWVLLHRDLTNRFYRLLISPQGIRMDTIEVEEAFADGLGQAVFSPDGTTYARVDRITFNLPTYIRLYDFDRCTGLLSNYQLDTNLVSPGAEFGAGLSISHNSRYLYVFHTEIVAQYDLKSPDPFESRVDIGIYDGFMSGPLYGSYFLFSQLGPDGRIYVASWGSTYHWHLLNFPNREGEASQFLQHHIAFPVNPNYDIPNLPNFRLGPLDGSPCDTLGLDNHPLANYRWEQEDSLQILDITFTDLSNYEPDTWYWDFGDGTHSNEQYPVHSYDSAGIYQVCLIVSNAFSSDTFCQTLYLGVSAIDNPILASQIAVSPNPFQEKMRVILSTALRSPVFRLYDNLGRLVRQTGLEYGITEIETGDLPTGLYFWEVMSGGERVVSGKVVKQ